MFRDGLGAWEKMTFGTVLPFTNGTVEFQPDEYVVGATSGALAWIDRVILRSGAWNGSAEGYLIVSKVVGTFVSESLSSTSAGANAAQGTPTQPIVIQPGGHYDFTNRNFCGASDRAHMYFASGTDTAFGWGGASLARIHTGI